MWLVSLRVFLLVKLCVYCLLVVCLYSEYDCIISIYYSAPFWFEACVDTPCSRTDWSKPPCSTQQLKTVTEKSSDVHFHVKTYSQRPHRSVRITNCVLQLRTKRLLCIQVTFSQSLMLLVGTSNLGYTSLIFVDPAVNIMEMLPSQQLLPAICHVWRVHLDGLLVEHTAVGEVKFW